MTEDYYEDTSYRKEKELDEIGLIRREMDRVNMARDTDDTRYCKSVENLILNLPRALKPKAYNKMQELGLERCRYKSVNEEKLVLYDDLQNYIRDNLLEKNNMIWVKKETKTYE